MISKNIAFISNYFWSQSINNINKHLSETEMKSFSSNDYYYLTTIYYLGSPNFSQIADSLKMSKPAISQLIRKFERLGLVEKNQSQHDKRFYYLSLTIKGKQIIDGDENLYRDFEGLIRSLVKDQDEFAYIDDLLNKIVLIMKNS